VIEGARLRDSHLSGPEATLRLGLGLSNIVDDHNTVMQSYKHNTGFSLMLGFGSRFIEPEVLRPSHSLWVDQAAGHRRRHFAADPVSVAAWKEPCGRLRAPALSSLRIQDLRSPKHGPA
jgi:hypothetical protein